MAGRGHSLLEPIATRSPEASSSRGPTPRSKTYSHPAPSRRQGHGNASFPTLWEDICENGFAKSIGRIGVDVCEEVNNATMALREEVAHISTLAPAIAEIQKSIQELEKRVENQYLAQPSSTGGGGAASTYIGKIGRSDQPMGDIKKADLSALGEDIQRSCSKEFKSYSDVVANIEIRLVQTLEKQFKDQKQDSMDGLGAKMTEIHGELQKLTASNTDVVIAAKNEISGIVSEVQKALSMETAKGVSTVQQKSAQLHTNLVDLMEAQIDDLRRRTDSKMNEIIEAQQTMALESAETAQSLKELHKIASELTSGLDHRLELQFHRHVHEGNVNVDFASVKEHISSTSCAAIENTKVIVGELTKIQQALNVDFAELSDTTHLSPAGKIASLKDREADMGYDAVKIKKRLREYWCQTDTKILTASSTQTDSSLMKDKNKDMTNIKKKMIAAHRKAKAEKDKLAIHKPVFADHEAMKKKMRQAMIQPQYNVMDYYHTTGVAQLIARSWLFEQITLAIILFNAIWIAVDTDYNDADVLIKADPIFQIVEHWFCAFFTFELLARFCAFEGKKHCLGDFWFCFDALLVLLMVAETWVLSIVMVALGPAAASSGLGDASILRMVRMVRMLRVSRMARLCRSIPELVILLKGIGVASRSVSVFFVLWLVIIYVYGVIFKQATENTDLGKEYFDSVLMSMNTLLLDGILPTNSPLVNEIAGSNPILWPVIMSFVSLAALTIMYMLIGVLVDIIGMISTSEREGMFVGMVASQLRDAFEELGRGTDAKITKFEFENLLDKAIITDIIRGAGVDIIALLDMTEIVFEQDDKAVVGISFEEFVEIVLNLRGNQHSTVKDVKEQIRIIKKFVVEAQDGLSKQLTRDVKSLRDELRELHSMTNSQDIEEDDDVMY